MKIFVTGSSGFIGKSLIEQLSEKYEIIEYDLTNGHDISDYKKLKTAMKDCEVVVHLAAIPRPVEGTPFNDYFKANCKGVLNVANAAVENRVKRLIFASSTSYYGIEKGIPFVKPVKEANPIVTQHVKVEDLNTRDCDIAYSTSKVIAEEILANYGLTKKLEVIILRLGPTRKKGEYRPFGEINLHLKIENAINAIRMAIESKKQLWYEAITITDENPHVDLTKAKETLNYKPIK